MTNQLKEQTSILWNNIADFETHEIKNDSKITLLANARQNARMEAYVNLFYKLLDNYNSTS